jgi:hydrogenase/urease accessory protein HupE
LTCGTVPAHEVRPAFLELTERVPGEFEVLWKVPALGGVPLAGEELPHEQPASVPDDPATPKTMPCGCPMPTAAELARGVLPIHPSLPKDCQIVVPPRIERLNGAIVKRWTIATGAKGLEGWEVTVHGLHATMVDVLVRIASADGRVVSRVLRPDATSFTYRGTDAGPRASGYFRLGVEHILVGVDHLLFVLCLLLLVRGVGRVVKTITAFTAAHSITLALATLGYVHVPSAPVEAGIALSIVFLAREIVKRREGAPSLTERQPWLVAFAFGLLHGLGFAGALSEVGLPPHDIPLALLLFNVGVEAGQLLFVAAVLLVVALARRLAFGPSTWLRPVPAYGIGTVAALWLVARVAAFW